MTPERMIRMDLDNLWKEGLDLKANRPDCPFTESLMGVIAQTRRTVLAQLDEIKASDQVAQGIAEAHTMTLDRTKEYTAAGGKWLWESGPSQWHDEIAQWLNEDTFILLNPVPVVEMETITKTITATFDEKGGCVAGSATGNFVRSVMSDRELYRDRYGEVINATAKITIELTRPKL